MGRIDSTNIRIKRDVKARMEETGRYGDTASDIVERLLDFYLKHRE